MSSSNAFPSPPTREQLLAITDRYLTAFANNKTHPLFMLNFFSTIYPVTIQHYPSSSTHPHSSVLRGPNAVRSYFDLLATHWTRTAVHKRTIDVNPFTRTVVFEGSVTWKWKKSGRSWVEEFTCTLLFDELLKIVSYAVRTDSPLKTCLMRAKDTPDDEPMSRTLPVGNGPVRISISHITIAYHLVLGLGLIDFDHGATASLPLSLSVADSV
ncbi:hypothetical protein H0H87_001128 [Tephrocybe sp. NHM501043]|nr:hypothetical protein H0H87_001128 [Tephrocybe sp. NHM501043]